MTTKLTDVERAAIESLICAAMNSSGPYPTSAARAAYDWVEREREQRSGDVDAWQKIAGERFDQIAAMHCKLAAVATLCRSLLVEDIDGSNGFAKAQKLAARVLEIVGEQQKEAAK